MTGRPSVVFRSLSLVDTFVPTLLCQWSYTLIVSFFRSNNIKVTRTYIIQALANDTTFSAAVDRLSYTTTAADAYFIMGGVKPEEGAVITKGRFAPDDIWRLDPASGRYQTIL